jgi:hypothetical protein
MPFRYGEEIPMPFRVIVAENSHYMDEKEHWEAGTFATLEEAVAKAKQIVDTSLDEALAAGGSEKEFYEHYVRWGDDPFIRVIDGQQDGVNFSAWDYAKERCAELTKKPRDYRRHVARQRPIWFRSVSR